jgi:hypothetical protein
MQTSGLFNYFVGTQHDRAWNYDAERLDGVDFATHWHTPDKQRFTGLMIQESNVLRGPGRR